MANHTSGAQRHNARMDKIFDRAKSEGRGLGGYQDKKKEIAKKAKHAIPKHFKDGLDYNPRHQ